MSVRAGSIVTVGGRNVIDRLQSVGLNDANVPIETIREVGNDLVVDKVPGDPDYTFSMESWDVTTDMMAFLTGKVGNTAANQAPGAADPAGTEYKWENCKYVNITSPWKGETGSEGGDVVAGLIVPGYFPTRLQYRLGVTENAQQTVELAGGSYYYAKTAPVQEYAAGTGVVTEFVTSEDARPYRIGGAGGTTFGYVFGVLVNGVLQVNEIDYTVEAEDDGNPGVATITFNEAPANAASVTWCYFTETAKAIPQAMNADTTIKPGAVRGRDIKIILDRAGANLRFGGVQSVELEATIEGEVEREMGNYEITGRSVTGTDTTGTITTRPKDYRGFFQGLEAVTGVAGDEVFGYFNTHTVPVDIEIYNPKNPGEILKTIHVKNGQFQPPGTPGRVNQATDFGFRFNAEDGTFSEFKGARP